MKKYLNKPLTTLLVTLLAVPIYLFSSTPEAQAAEVTGGGSTSIVSEGNSPVTLLQLTIEEERNDEFVDGGKITLSISDETSAKVLFAASTVTIDPSLAALIAPGDESIDVTEDQSTIEITIGDASDSEKENLTINNIKVATNTSGTTDDFFGKENLIVAVDSGDPKNGALFDVDAQKPIVTINNPIYTSDQTPEISGTVNDGSAVIELKVNGISYSDKINGVGTIEIDKTKSPCEWTLVDDKISALAEGVYDVTATATDTANNSSSDSTTGELIIDITKPTMPTIDPVLTPVNAQSQTITGTKEAETMLFVTGGKSVATVPYDNFEGYSVVVDLTENSDNILRVNAIDRAGNLSETATITITTDSIPPAVPQNSTGVVGGDNIKITWNEVDDAISYQIWRSASPYVLIATLPAGTTEYIDYDVTAGTTYYYKILAIDSAGNGSSTEEIAVYFPTKAVTTTASVKKTTTVASVTTPPATTSQESTGEEQEILDEEATDDQGVIKGDTSEESEDEEFNWTPWIILIIIVALAGAATGGYFYWTREEEILPKVDVTVSQPKKKSSSKTTSGKNKSEGRGSSKQRW